MTTIRELDAAWNGHSRLTPMADRHSLLIAGDALAEAAQAYLDHLNVEQGPDNSEQMLTWAETDYRLVEALRPAIAAWKAVTG